MASKQSTADFILEQIEPQGSVTARKMFGEYGLFCADKMVALIADDLLYVKPTPGGKAFAGPLEEAPPYPGAKNCLLIPGEKWDDREWISELIRITTVELKPPVKKAKKKK